MPGDSVPAGRLLVALFGAEQDGGYAGDSVVLLGVALTVPSLLAALKPDQVPAPGGGHSDVIDSFLVVGTGDEVERLNADQMRDVLQRNGYDDLLSSVAPVS